MKRLIIILTIILGFFISLMWGEECTTAVVSGLVTGDGAPILWKNRDTDVLNNKVVFVREKPYNYLALVNAKETSGRIVWAGLNSEGFAIMNSVAYNLPQKSGEMEDLEGMVMADALRKCSTVDEFEEYLKKNLGESLGCRTNFGVIDAHGGASLFEVHNHGYKRIDAREFKEGYIINTNFSRSGEENKGRGYIRFERASALFKNAGVITPEFILQKVARDLENPFFNFLSLDMEKVFSGNESFWIHTDHTINRYITASCVVIHGVKKGEKGRPAMWVILGEPVCSIAIPLWVDGGEPPPPLWEGETAPICSEAFRLKDIIRPFKDMERRQYLDIKKLMNWLPVILEKEKEILEKTKKFLAKNPSPAELVKFENEVAQIVLETLKNIK